MRKYVRKLIVGLVVVLAVALAGDFGTAAYAEYRLSRALREGGALTSDPAVTIYGFPFLTQVANGEYQRIEIRADDVPTEFLDKTTIEATLRGVTVPASNLFDGSVRLVPVEQLDGRVTIDATELGRYISVPDLQISPPPPDESAARASSEAGSRGAVVLSGTVPVGPARAQVSVTAELRLDGDKVEIVATDLYFGPQGNADFSVPDVLKPAVLSLFTRTVDRQDLPFGITPTIVYAEGGRIVIGGTARDVTVDTAAVRSR